MKTNLGFLSLEKEGTGIGNDISNAHSIEEALHVGWLDWHVVRMDENAV